MHIKKGLNSGVATITAAIIIVVIMATSFLAGMSIGHGNGSAAYVINGAPVPRNLQQPLNNFWQAYQRLNADSYWRPFDPKQLFYGATSGMVDTSTLPQDSHTLFFPPVDSTQANAQLNETSNGYGIGADVVMTKKGLQITNPLVDSPAQKAGLLQNDLIVAVNGRDIRKLSLTDAVDLIHGNQGTVVALSIVRSGLRQPFVVKVTRNSIPDVQAGKIRNIGYIKFTVFGLATAGEVHDALVQLLSAHVTGVVLDLRDNLGGYVNAAQAIAGEFLPGNDVLFWERTNLGNGHFSDTSNLVGTTGIAQHLPLVVLVNGYTASAAEIVAAAMSDHGRAKTIGTRTYGKNSEQEVVNLADGSSMRITTHLWLTPNKHSVSGGFEPDIVVSKAASGPDTQLTRAVQYLSTNH